VARLPHPLRYAAVAAVGGRIMVAGGTNGLRGRREVAGGRDARGTVHGEVWSLAVG
jgi:hypothetical protein